MKKLACCVIGALLASPATAGWTYLNIDQVNPSGGTARPNFGYARACKTPMLVSGYPVFRVRLEAERNPAISRNSFVRITVVEPEGRIRYASDNWSWYGAWASVWIDGAIFSDNRFTFQLGDAGKGVMQIGRRWTPEGYRYSFSGDQLATC